ncbi:Hsp20/alpha crystallin family protein [Tundrisphaera sp. TA3]|uniref:Hsp20/alpha crystallin family protein n=1 Tax=Tundrisphaera sp. TA3 TaxID=3435775 RepID=UPI003EB941D8
MIRPGLWRREFSVPLQTLQGELNRLIEGYWQSQGGPASPEAGVEPDPSSAWTPAIDLVETPTEVILVADLPGVDPTSIDLSLTGSVLSLRGEKAAFDVADPQDRTRERPSGPFHRQIVLTDEVEFDLVQAESKNGVLTVRLPRRVAAKPRSIPIQTAAK